MLSVLFLVRQFGIGGAERQLLELIRAMDRQRFRVTVVSLYDGGDWSGTLSSIEGIDVRSLGKRGRYDVRSFLRLIQLVRSVRPAIVQTVGVSDVFGIVGSSAARSTLVISIINSDMQLKRYGWLESLLFSLGPMTSRPASALIANSYAGKAYYASHGYVDDKIAVISNGFDTGRFVPDRDGRRRQRGAWGVEDETLLVGIVARLDPMKDHDSFFVAAGILARRNPKVRFVVVGPGAANELARLHTIARREGCSDRVIWAGPAADMVAVYNALDLCVSTSISEGLSNVLGEAMACGTPCIATDAGDSPLIINDPSRIVPRGRPELFAAAWEHFLAKPVADRLAAGFSDRQRIIESFSIELAADRFQSYLENLVHSESSAYSVSVGDLSGH